MSGGKKTVEDALPPEAHLGVYRAILHGLHTRGEGGVLWVDGEECSYCFPHEFPNAAFAEGLQDMLRRPGSSEVFFVVHPSGGKAHVICYPRRLVQQAVGDAAAREGAARLLQRRWRERRRCAHDVKTM